jgi:hypothetical protein
VVLPTRSETVVRGFLPAPVVLAVVVFPDFIRVVVLVPRLVVRMVVLAMTIPPKQAEQNLNVHHSN